MKKALYTDILFFDLPDTFEGNISDALRLLADYLDRKDKDYIEKGDLPTAIALDKSNSFTDFIISAFKEFKSGTISGYKTVNGFHIINYTTEKIVNRIDELNKD